MINERTVQIRSLHRDEIDRLQELMRSPERFFNGVRTHSHEQRFHAQQGGAADYLIAWLQTEPVGHALLRWTGANDQVLLDNGVRDPYVEGLAVRQDVQRRGIGTAMMLEAERLARDRGHSRIVLAVGVENERARALYRKLGYIESGLGEVEVTWTYVDADGNEGIGRERCTYLIKHLPPHSDARPRGDR